MVRVLTLILLVLPRLLFAQTIEVEAKTDSSLYLVGDYIHYKIDLKYDKNIKVYFPSVKDSVKDAEFISQAPVKRDESDGKVIEERDFVFSKYDSGAVVFPPLPIYYTIGADTTKSVIRTNEVKVTVQTINVDPQGRIQDVKPPVTVPYPWWWILLAVLGVIAVAALAYWLWRRRQFKDVEKKIVKKVVVPPDKLALQRLRELEEKKLWQQGKIKDYHSEITEIIRRYFEDRFKILAMESTSSEIIEQLAKVDEAGKILDITRHFLSNADMVKFAKFEPMPSVNEEMMKQAVEIVKSTPVKEAEVKTEEAGDV